MTHAPAGAARPRPSRVEAQESTSHPRSDGALEALERILAATPAQAIPALIAALSARLAAAAAEGLRPQGGREPGPEPDENLSIDEAARRLGISKDFLYRTKLPFKVRIGRRVLFSARGLERWNQNRQGR